jgi:antitoxin VapB
MLNIKDPVAHELAKELAERLKTSMTQAVVVALRHELDRAKADDEGEKKARFDRLMSIAREIRDTYGPLPSMKEIDAEMYDENGLPK